MPCSIEKPIAYFFLINSVILCVYGVIKPGMVVIGAESVNLDVIWGAVMGTFGIFMLAWSVLEKRKSV